MPPRVRWPNGAEEARVSTISLAKDAREVLDMARGEVAYGNPAREYIADVQAALADIQRLMVTAKRGE